MHASSRAGSTTALVLAAGLLGAIGAFAVASFIGIPVGIDAPTRREADS